MNEDAGFANGLVFVDKVRRGLARRGWETSHHLAAKTKVLAKLIHSTQIVVQYLNYLDVLIHAVQVKSLEMDLGVCKTGSRSQSQYKYRGRKREHER